MRGEELLIQYIESGLSREERFELEKLTLDDDFLADAYEGITGPDSKQAALIIDRIRKYLDKQKVKDKVVPMYRKIWPYAVAASLIFVVSVGILLRPTSDMTSYAQETSIDTYNDATVAEAMEEDNDFAAVVETIVVEESNRKAHRTDEESSQAFAVQLENTQSANVLEEASSLNEKTQPIDDLSTRKSKKEILASPRASSKEINLSRRASIEKSDLLSDQVTGFQKIALEDMSIPNAEALSDDPILNGLTTEKLRATPQGEKPVPIPNELEAAEFSLSNKSEISNAPRLKKERAAFESLQNIELDSNGNVAIVGSEFTLTDETTVDLASAPELGESVIINTSPQSFGKAFTADGLMVATLEAEDLNDCATAKAKYRSEYEENPDPASARDLYNLLKKKGCLTDGSDTFMVELKKNYEVWAAKENAIVRLDPEEPNSVIAANDLMVVTLNESSDSIDYEAATLAGAESYRLELQRNSTISKDELFMRGLKKPSLAKVKIKCNDSGIPIKVVVNPSLGPYFDKKIQEMIKSSGPWKVKPNHWILYEFNPPFQKR